MPALVMLPWKLPLACDIIDVHAVAIGTAECSNAAVILDVTGKHRASIESNTIDVHAGFGQSR